MREFSSTSENRQNRKCCKSVQECPIASNARGVHFNHRKTMYHNDSLDAGEILNVYLHLYD